MKSDAGLINAHDDVVTVAVHGELAAVSLPAPLKPTHVDFSWPALAASLLKGVPGPQTYPGRIRRV